MARFSFVQITDHHLTASEGRLTRGFSPAYSLRAVLRDVSARVGDEIDFVLTTGDLVEPASEEAYDSARRLLGVEDEPASHGPVRLQAEGLDHPLYLFPGNHDEPSLLFGAAAAAHTAFEHKGIRFVWLDWGRGGQAAADAQLFPFLERELADPRPSIVVTHHHFVALGVPWLDALLPTRAERDRFFELISRSGVLAVVSGHAHTTYAQRIRGVPAYGVRSTSFQFAGTDSPVLTLEPPAYRLVTVDDGVVTTSVFEVPLPG
jgi:3',5'-cyclic AMP phosphodiesterase CpdA